MNDSVERCVSWAMSAMVLGGCGAKACTPTILESRAQPYVADIPVPVNFTLGRKSDHTFTAGHRSVKHIYEGKEPLLAVRNFYVHYMPLSQWELLDETLQNGVYLLNFQKGQERCEIRIERIPSGFFGEITQVHATLRSASDQMAATGAD